MEPQIPETTRSADALNHPSQEQWMDFLHGELPAKTRAPLKAHLSRCEVCRSRVAQWKTAMGALDQWVLPEIRSTPLWQPWLRWAAAALIILGAGFGAGRLNARTLDTERIRIAVETSLRQQLAGEARSECQKAMQTARAQIIEEVRSELDQTALETLAASSAETRRLLSEFNNTYALDRTEDKQALLTAWRSLRKELETVAVLTQESLDKAQNQLLKLASLNESSGILPNP